MICHHRLLHLCFVCVFVAVSVVSASVASTQTRPVVHIGSKNFTESYILAEILAQKIERTGLASVERRFGMGGTGLVYSALKSGAIDIYPEYTGTISVAILHSQKQHSPRELSQLLGSHAMELSQPLGFNNSYALAVSKKTALKFDLKRISDLRSHKQLRMTFSHEFMERHDGYPSLIRHYRLSPVAPVRMDHALVYTALAEGQSDVAEVYTTDPKVSKFELTLLEDDLKFFPRYDGLYLYRHELREKWPNILEVLQELEGQISDAEMTRLNGLVELSGMSFRDAATEFLDKDRAKGQASASDHPASPTYLSRLWVQTKQHLMLVLIPTLVSVLIGIPMGIAAAKIPVFGQVFLIVSGLLQTIPSLALLCFLIPIFGIGLVPSIVALILYGLLPVVRNTYGGITSIDPRHREVAQVLGLNQIQTLVEIELPLATTHIMGGIKTAAIMSVGMATLAAFIGAGGYGAWIVTGLALNDNVIILQGALPAAGLALIVHFVFEWAGQWLTPSR